MELKAFWDLVLAYRWPQRLSNIGRPANMLGTILIVLLILMLLGAIPTWPHSQSWGYAPGGIVFVILMVLLILMLAGKLPF